MERVRQLAERAARSSLPVLIEGERGVGKELLAPRHPWFERHGAGGPFVMVRCGDFDEGKVEAALFGSRARRRRKDRAKQAAARSFSTRSARFPRVRRRRSPRMLGDGDSEARAHALPGDVRLIAATSRRLIDLVAAGEFREDLFNRLNVLPIWLPPLRERRADIPDLARARSSQGFAAEAGAVEHRRAFRAAAMELLAGA